jgi:hypothetical protein
VLTLAAIVLGWPMPADLDPDPDVVAWLDAADPPRAAARADGVQSGASGWAVARVGGASVFFRAGRLRHRPAHLDQLQVDIRFGRQEVIVDAGSFAYNRPEPWNNGLVSAFAHNAPVLDDREPAERGPRFLWYSWPDAALSECVYRNGVATLAGEVPGRVRRVITVTATQVTVVDRVLDTRVTSVQTTWLLHPAVPATAIEAEGATVVEAHEGHTAGWFSETYGVRLPSRVVRIRRSAGRHETRGVTMTATIGPTGE